MNMCASVCVMLWTCKAPFPQSIAGLLDSVWPRLLVAIRYTMKRRKSEHGERRSVSLVWQCSYSICIRNMWYEGNLDALTFGICYIFVHFFCCNSSFGSGHLPQLSQGRDITSRLCAIHAWDGSSKSGVALLKCSWWVPVMWLITNSIK